MKGLDLRFPAVDARAEESSSRPRKRRCAARAPDPYRMPGHVHDQKKPRRPRRTQRQTVLFLLCGLCVLGGSFRTSSTRRIRSARCRPRSGRRSRRSRPPTRRGSKPWTKLADLKAQHKGEANWREVIVDDGRLTGEYVAAAPGTKVPKRFHPDTREWFAVVEGEVQRRDRRPGAVHRDARIARQHPAADDLLARNDRRQAEPALHRQRRAREDAVPARRRPRRRRRPPPAGIVVGAGDAQPHRRPVRSVQPAAP